MRSLVPFACVLAVGCGFGEYAVGADAAPPDTSVDDADATVDSSEDLDTADASDDESSAVDGDGGESGGSSAGVGCGSETCAPGMRCCVSFAADGGPLYKCATECAPGAAPFACDGPEDCAAGETCCAVYNLSGSSPPCKILFGRADCRAGCAVNMPGTCSEPLRVRSCRTPADCTDPAYGKCCDFDDGTFVVRFCASSGFAAFAKKCH